MAFIRRTRGGNWGVYHGGTGRLIRAFRGRNAKERAQMEMRRLHRKHDPLARNRGKRAARRFR